MNKSVQQNILSGITVGIVALPLSMALAIASGVAPQHGLYTSIVAGTVIALSGSSKVNISGPTAAFVVILLPITGQYGLGGLLISGLMAGFILLAMGLGRLGTLVELVPYPVTVGFTAGIAVVIATIQIKDFLGLTMDAASGYYTQKVSHIISALPTFQANELCISLATLFILIMWPKSKIRIPSHLVALTAGSLIAFAGQHLFPSFSVETIGSTFQYDLYGLAGKGIPPVSPHFTWPWELPDAAGNPVGFSFDLVSSLLGAAFAIAMLGAIESLLCAVVADGLSGTKTDPNRELIGQGIGNIIIPFFGGVPATAAFARTVMNIRSGGTNALSSIVHSLFILCSILTLSPFLAYIPMASLAALLMIVAWNMSEARHFIHIVKVAPRDDVMVLLTCFSLTVIFDMEIALATGMALAAILFIKRIIELTGTTVISKGDSREYPDLREEVMIYDINGPMFFGAAQNALKILFKIRKEIRVVILDMRDVPMMDMTAMVAMGSIIENFRKNSVGLVFNGMNQQIQSKLRKAGMIIPEMEIEFFDTIEESIQKANELADRADPVVLSSL